MRRKLVAGNWTMNGTSAALAEVRSLASGGLPGCCDVLLCPPATSIARVAEAARGGVGVQPPDGGFRDGSCADGAARHPSQGDALHEDAEQHHGVGGD